MTAEKKILLVSATRGKNHELAQDLKEIIDNTTSIDTAVINLESYGLALYMPDIETENDFMNVIKNISGKKTIFFISHRPNVLKFCNVVYKLENGKLLKTN